MAFVPEDGTGLSDATSLVTLAYANAYWTDRPRAAAGKWASATDAQKQESLMRATQFVCAEQFQGSVVKSDQALVLPRYFSGTIEGRYYPTGMPGPILDAVCELANEDLGAILDEALERGGELKSETIGPLSFVYADGAEGGTLYRRVEKLLDPFRRVGAGQGELVLS